MMATLRILARLTLAAIREPGRPPGHYGAAASGLPCWEPCCDRAEAAR